MKYSNQGEIMLMGDLNAHINCNEQDCIRNDSDGILDSFFYLMITLLIVSNFLEIHKLIKLQTVMVNQLLNYVIVVN